MPLPGRDEETAREIAELREKHEVSDLRSQQTLSAVHETLEKVVDRLAMLEDDVIETRAAQAEHAPSAYAPTPFLEAQTFQQGPFHEQPAAFAPAARSAQDAPATPFQDKRAAPYDDTPAALSQDKLAALSQDKLAAPSQEGWRRLPRGWRRLRTSTPTIS